MTQVKDAAEFYKHELENLAVQVWSLTDLAFEQNTSGRNSEATQTVKHVGAVAKQYIPDSFFETEPSNAIED